MCLCVDEEAIYMCTCVRTYAHMLVGSAECIRQDAAVAARLSYASVFHSRNQLHCH